MMRKLEHYKGRTYQLIGPAKHSETLDELVVYQALYNEFQIWARPREMFLGQVEVDGQMVDRFRVIEEYTLQTHADEDGHVWLDKAIGEDRILYLPDYIYGIKADAFKECKGLKKLWIPASVEVIEKDTFAHFDTYNEIFCEAEKEPAGWYRDEKCIHSYTEDYGRYFDMVASSWLGDYKYTCNDEDYVTNISFNVAFVKWGRNGI